jgi:hypothetical protein
MEPAVAAPDTEGCFEVKRVKTSILLDPQYLGDISIGVSCGGCQSILCLPHAHTHVTAYMMTCAWQCTSTRSLAHTHATRLLVEVDASCEV